MLLFFLDLGHGFERFESGGVGAGAFFGPRLSTKAERFRKERAFAALVGFETTHPHVTLPTTEAAGERLVACVEALVSLKVPLFRKGLPAAGRSADVATKALGCGGRVGRRRGRRIYGYGREALVIAGGLASVAVAHEVEGIGIGIESGRSGSGEKEEGERVGALVAEERNFRRVAVRERRTRRGKREGDVGKGRRLHKGRK